MRCFVLFMFIFTQACASMPAKQMRIIPPERPAKSDLSGLPTQVTEDVSQKMQSDIKDCKSLALRGRSKEEPSILSALPLIGPLYLLGLATQLDDEASLEGLEEKELSTFKNCMEERGYEVE